MVHYSSPHNLPAPDDSDPVAAYAAIARQLVDKLDDDVVGTLVTSLAGSAAAANWTVTSLRAVKFLGGRFAYIDFVCTRNAGAAVITASASGNIVDTDVAQVPAAFRPVRRQYGSADRSSLGRWQVFLEAATGMLVVSAGPATATINPGDTLQFQGFVELL